MSWSECNQIALSHSTATDQVSFLVISVACGVGCVRLFHGNSVKRSRVPISTLSGTNKLFPTNITSRSVANRGCEGRWIGLDDTDLPTKTG